MPGSPPRCTCSTIFRSSSKGSTPTTTAAPRRPRRSPTGYFDFTRWSQFKLRVGQFRPLFGLEHITSDNLLGFQERSLTESLIQDIGYDRGMMVHGAPFAGLYYSVALTNGSGQNLDNNNNASSAQSDGFDTTARVRANLAEWLGRTDMILHGGVSYNQGTMAMRVAPDTSPEAAYALTGGRSLKFFDPEPFTGSDVDRRRWGLRGHGPTGR
jgi:phosphate-selective porin OprO/OprP